MCDNLLAWAVGSAPSGIARVLTGRLHALDTPFDIRVRRRAARGVTLGEPMGTRVSSHRDHDGL